MEIDVDEKIAVKVSLDEFADKIEAHVWSKLAPLSWRSYDEAVAFVHGLNLRNLQEWGSYCAGERQTLPVKPVDIPRSPWTVYTEFYARGGVGAWLGTGSVAAQLRDYRSYEIAREFVRSLKLKSTAAWRSYCKRGRPDLPPKPLDIPAAPATVYGIEFSAKGGMGAWLGTTNKKRGWRVSRRGRYLCANSWTEERR